MRHDHVDGSARPQTVSRETNRTPFLLEAAAKLGAIHHRPARNVGEPPRNDPRAFGAATDDVRIRDAVQPTGVEVAMTRADHPTGTDRLAEVAARLDADVVVNVQGDLPFVEPAMVERLVARLDADPSLPMATLAAYIRDEAEWRSPHVVKVVAGLDGRALYFSRSPIPCDRDGARPADEPFGLRHIGMYAYRRDVLLRLASLRPSPLERREQLE